MFVYHALSFAQSNHFEVLPSLLSSSRSFLRAIINKYTQPAVDEEKEGNEEKEDEKESLSDRAARWARRNTVPLMNAERDFDRKNDAKHTLACYAMYVNFVLFVCLLFVIYLHCCKYVLH